MSGGFTPGDYAVMGVYLVGVVALGAYFARGQNSLKEYFLAGRAMPWWAVALSIIATDLSAVSYTGVPAWVYEKDLQYALTTVMLPVAMVIVVALYVPLFYRLQVYTVYEYLGRRFGSSIRLVACLFFLLVRGGWLATIIYTPSYAVSYITGIPLWVCVLTVGLSTTFYTVLGGMKAVIWTDVMQFIVLVGGAIVIAAVLILRVDGGLPGIWRIASESGHTKFFTFSLDPTIEVTVWSATFGILFICMNSYGCDQVVAQRYFTVGSVRKSIQSALSAGLLIVPVNILLYFIGVGLAAYYTLHPHLAAALPESRAVMSDFIARAMPTGVSGLLIAGIFAATMSSIDSGIQSLTTTTIIDIVRPLRAGGPSTSERWELGLARILIVAWGIAATVAGLCVGHLGTFIKITGIINNFFGGPLGGLFLLAVLVPRSNSPGALIGAGAGFTWTCWLATCTHVSWMWWGLSGGMITVTFGALASLFFPPPSEEKRRLTLAGAGSLVRPEGQNSRNAADKD